MVKRHRTERKIFDRLKSIFCVEKIEFYLLSCQPDSYFDYEIWLQLFLHLNIVTDVVNSETRVRNILNFETRSDQSFQPLHFVLTIYREQTVASINNIELFIKVLQG